MRVDLFGVQIDRIRSLELVETLSAWAGGAAQRRVFYVNAHAINLAYKNPQFMASLRHADLVFCDGVGVSVAGFLVHRVRLERMTPPDWIDDFLATLDGHRSVYLLGDDQGVAEKCASTMRSRHPDLTIAGIHHGFFDTDGPENDRVVRLINEAGARVLIVGMGMPRQEFWIDENMPKLEVRLAIPVGALFRWYSGADSRAPHWITDHGLEWASRLLKHPIRHFRRYVLGLPLFGWRVARQALYGCLPRRIPRGR